MMDNIGNNSNKVFLYRPPKINVIFVNTQSVLCQSNDWTTYSDPEEDQLP